jgi:hypothetical protein
MSPEQSTSLSGITLDKPFDSGAGEAPGQVETMTGPESLVNAQEQKKKVGMDFLKKSAFPIAVLGGSLYLGMGRLKNLREGKGCPKCETTQAVVAFVLAAWAGWELWRSYKG